MIIYLDEDGSYLSWVARHRDGFVVDWLRRPTNRRPILHRASCERIRVAKSKRTHWTSGRRLKACAVEQEQLLAWASAESGRPPACCEDCRPGSEPADSATADTGHVTKLGLEAVDYVTEVALIHLDSEQPAYDLTVADVAAYLNKTLGQIAPSLRRLARSGHLRFTRDVDPELRGGDRLFPTSDALRMLAAFEHQSLDEIEEELSLLSEEEN